MNVKKEASQVSSWPIELLLSLSLALSPIHSFLSSSEHDKTSKRCSYRERVRRSDLMDRPDSLAKTGERARRLASETNASISVNIRRQFEDGSDMSCYVSVCALIVDNNRLGSTLPSV